MVDIKRKQLTREMYGWSKYGGARQGLVKEELDVWFCQACAREQLKDQAQYMVRFTSERAEYARVCSPCKNVILDKNLITFRQLIRRVRQKSIYYDY